MRRWRTAYLGFLTATVCALLLYMPFRSRQWDLNELAEARAVDAGGAELFSRNHLLYRPLGFVTVALARVFGYEGHSAVVLKYLTVCTAAIGVGLFWLWIKKLTTALESFIPVQGLSLKGAVKGLFHRGEFLVGLSLAAFVVLCALTCVGAFAKRADIKPVAVNLVWLCAAYVAYIPFIIWWDPFEAKWFIVPNLFFVAALAQVWGVLFVKRRSRVTVGVCVAVIAAANFVHFIWPRHSKPNPNIQLARCFAEHADGKDTVVLTDWNWSGYAVYFFGYKGRELWLIGGAGDKGVKVRGLSDRVGEAGDSGGHVYMRDLDTYSPDELAAAASLTGLTRSDFDIFGRRAAFSCGNVRFIQLTQIK